VGIALGGWTAAVQVMQRRTWRKRVEEGVVDEGRLGLEGKGEKGIAEMDDFGKKEGGLEGETG